MPEGSGEIPKDIIEKNSYAPLKELRLPGNQEALVTVAHFCRTPEARERIVREGLWSIAGRDTLTIYRGPDYFLIANGNGWQKTYNQGVEPILFKVPKKYLGYADTNVGGRLGTGGRGLAIYKQATRTEQNGPIYEDIINGRYNKELAYLYKRGYPITHLPAESVVDTKAVKAPNSLERTRHKAVTFYQNTFIGAAGISAIPSIEAQSFLATLPKDGYLKSGNLSAKSRERGGKK